jgi:1-aminocyclopropane-1-carboxylate deaminase/D-cysteine desulfhydrase-like pyridoxal-dependent ACC family enzyme
VIGVCVRRDAASQRMRIRARCQELAELLGIDPVVDDDDILLLDEFLGPGYGQLNRPTLEAMRSAAQREGLVVDPVYTARAMAGLLQRARMGRPGRSLLVFHTGGTPAVFAYEPALTEYLSDAR